MALERLSKVQKKGQITIPAEIRQDWGLEEGDLVAFIQTTDGVVISPQVMVSTRTLNKIAKILEGNGIEPTSILPSTQKSQREDVSAPNGPDIVAFLRQVEPAAYTDTLVNKSLAIVRKSFGAFHSTQEPSDAKASREAFITHLGTERPDN